jgi:hypothetical protein
MVSVVMFKNLLYHFLCKPNSVKLQIVCSNQLALVAIAPQNSVPSQSLWLSMQLGVQYLMGDNLKVVLAEFSTISLSVLLQSRLRCMVDMQPLLELKTRLRL